MAKILLVEDDNNLREIYEARLQAEGYAIISAKDGEEALVLAKSEHPDLIISDVMMPRVSGFEMLDILRNTEGLRDTKIIMLTALGQAEDKTRADSLGADRYLVKSQVTLEDIVKAAEELLNQTAAVPAVAAPVATAAPQVMAVAPAPAAVAPPAPTVQPAAAIPVAPSPPSPSAVPGALIPVGAPTPSANPVAQTPTPMPTTPAPAPTTPNAGVAQTLTQSTSNEAADMQAQIDDFVSQPATGRATSVSAPEPTPSTAAPATANPAPAPTAPQPNSTVIRPEPPLTPPDTEATDQLVADAVKNLSSGTDVPQPLAPQPPTTTPLPAAAATPPPTLPPANNQAAQDDDAVTVAHKKIIKPITDPAEPAKPDLNELMAREGIDNLDEVPHQPTAAPLPTQPSSYTTPHPPGHVISPTSASANGGAIDPNTIAI